MLGVHAAMTQPIYTNVQRVSFGNDRMFRVSFADRVEEDSPDAAGKAELRAVMLMTPEVFVGLVKAMTGLIGKYEQDHGQIGNGRILVPRLKPVA